MKPVPEFRPGTVLFALAVLAVALPVGPGYHLLETRKLGGTGKWDYVAFDTTANRVFLAHGDQVDVVDGTSLQPVGRIANTPGVHGIAFAPELHRGFTSNGDEGSVTIFDLASLKELGRTRVTGADPDAIVYDGVTRRVFTMNGDGANTTALDAATGEVAGTVALGGGPEFGVADGTGLVFINLEDKSALVTLDARKLAVVRTVPLAPCERPTGMALDRTTRRLFIGCRNRLLAIVDADAGTVLQTLPIGDRVDANVFDAERGLAFSSNGDGTLTVIGLEASGYIVKESVATKFGARTMALDPRTHRLFLATADFGPVPAPTTAEPHPRPPALPGTFSLLVVGP